MNLGNNLFQARKKAGLSQETDETIPDIYQSKKWLNYIICL